MKKLIFLLSMTFISVLSFSEGGLDIPLTTDGKLHEEKFLNKRFSYPETSDEFQIEKDANGYILTNYYDESDYLEKQVPIKIVKIRLKVHKNSILIPDKNCKDACYLGFSYDTKLKRVVILDLKDMKIIYHADDVH